MTRGVAPRVGRPSAKELAEREGQHGRALRALGHVTRRQILVILAEGEQPVHALADQFSVSRPMVSKHLRVLAEAGLVAGRQVGRERHYRLVSGGLGDTALRLARADGAHHERTQALRSHLKNQGSGRA